MGPYFRWKGIPFGNFPKLRERGAPSVTCTVTGRLPECGRCDIRLTQPSASGPATPNPAQPSHNRKIKNNPRIANQKDLKMDGIPGLELFNSYEQEFNDLVISIRNSLNAEAKNSAGEQRKAILRRVERDLEEAEEIVSQMDVEFQSLDKALKPTINQKLKSFKSELQGFKSQIKQAHSQTTIAEDRSNNSAYPDDSGVFNSSTKAQAHRERLLKANQLLESSSGRLDSSHRIALETEELGVGILRDLRGQREQIEGTRDTLRDADGHIDKASNTLNKMIRRMNRQRLISGAIIAVLVILILFILYSKLH
ncbi:hypothetical protein O181_017437 [Austropuccinia psidii MF-1]|uniref:t-SNARE coiled-coil homology domain-containing protein n=1 Tax=Austropuccinia psidii MF-1 TaxID=1389203 RepID=A0A9Q3C7L3_9BASI|nr:hypothetical protein [Austropuccinia psidii MF-1]